MVLTDDERKERVRKRAREYAKATGTIEIVPMAQTTRTERSRYLILQCTTLFLISLI